MRGVPVSLDVKVAWERFLGLPWKVSKSFFDYGRCFPYVYGGADGLFMLDEPSR